MGQAAGDVAITRLDAAVIPSYRGMCSRAVFRGDQGL